MNELRRSFDWLAFGVRVVVVVAMTSWILAESGHKHDRTEVIVAAGIGYVILPAVAYLHTRYYNTIFIGWIIEAVRRKTAGRVPRQNSIR